MSHIQTEASGNMFFCNTHQKIHYTHESRKVKMTCDVSHLRHFISIPVC